MARKLTARGHKHAARVAHWLQQRLPSKFVVLASPAERTRQTALALATPFKTVASLSPGPAAKAPPVWGDMPMPDSAEIVRRARFVLTNYAMMDGMARQHGARFFMFLQPTAMNRRTLTDAERQALGRLDKSFMDRARPVVRIFYPAAIAAGKRFAFHDITGCLDEFAEPAYADECHYLDAATPTVAAAVCDVIAPAAAEIAASRRVPARVAAPPALR